MDINSQKKYLLSRIIYYVDLFNKKRQKNKFLALGIKIVGVCLGASLTVLLGITFEGKSDTLFKNIALGLGASITVFNAWDAFFKHRALWQHFTTITVKLHVVREDLGDKQVNGYTVIDAMKAIVDLSPIDMVKLYGMTSERVMVFTGANTGRSSMVALKVTNLRPGFVVFHGSEKIDDLAKRIAELESIPLGTVSKSNKEFLKTLKTSF